MDLMTRMSLTLAYVEENLTGASEICPMISTISFTSLTASISDWAVPSAIYDTLQQISQSSSRVASESKQVSSGAQALAQGATEQASAVQELAATMANPFPASPARAASTAALRGRMLV